MHQFKSSIPRITFLSILQTIAEFKLSEEKDRMLPLTDIQYSIEFDPLVYFALLRLFSKEVTRFWGWLLLIDLGLLGVYASYICIVIVVLRLKYLTMKTLSLWLD